MGFTISTEVIAAFALFCVGCLSPESPDPAFEGAVRIGSAGAPKGLNIGFDALDTAAVARVGDSVIAHVVAETSDGVVERFVRLTLVGRTDDVVQGTIDTQYLPDLLDRGGLEPTPTSLSMRNDGGLAIASLSADGVVDVTVFDKDGAQLGKRRVGANVLLAFATNGTVDPAMLDLGAVPLLQIVMAVPELDALLMSVASRPPLWTIVNGINLTLKWPSESITLRDNGLYMHNSTIECNGRVALDGSVLRGVTAAPYLLVTGLRRIEANHPDRSDRRAIVSIIGARRGNGPCLYDKPAGPFPAPDREGRVDVDPSAYLEVDTVEDD